MTQNAFPTQTFEGLDKAQHEILTNEKATLEREDEILFGQIEETLHTDTTVTLMKAFIRRIEIARRIVEINDALDGLAPVEDKERSWNG